MPLLPSSQRDQMKVAIGAIAVAIAGYYYTYPYAARAAELDAAREHLEAIEGKNARARAQATRGDVARMQTEAERAGAGLTAMRRLVPTEHEVPALLEEISTAARRANLEISGVTPDPVLRGAEFDTYRYKISVTGGYHALTAFLANVGSLPRIVAPVSFTLAPAGMARAKLAPNGPAPLAASVTLQTYVTHPPTSASKQASAGETQP